MRNHMPTALQDRFEAALVAICTQGVRIFYVLLVLLKNISEGSPIKLFKFVFGLLSFPCFKTGEVLFQFVYFLNRRRIARLGGYDLFPEISNGRIPFYRVVKIFYRLRDVEHRLERANPCNNFSNHGSLHELHSKRIRTRSNQVAGWTTSR